MSYVNDIKIQHDYSDELSVFILTKKCTFLVFSCITTRGCVI